jgi:hypothetical protein
MTDVLPTQSIVITKDLVQVSFDRTRGLIPAGVLGIATKGYALVPNAIREGLVTAVFLTNFMLISKHELYEVQPDFLHINRKNLLWFELNSRVVTIREGFYARYSEIPTRLDLIPHDVMNRNVESTIEEMFKLNS